MSEACPKCPGCKERDERNAALEAEIVELRRAINGIAPTDPTRFEDLDLCVALNNHADLAAVLSWLQRLAPAGSPQPGGPAQFAQWVVESVQRDFAAVATVVRAAAMQAEVRDAWTALIDSAASATYYDACETTEGAARALPADVRERLMTLERMGVDHE